MHILGRQIAKLKQTDGKPNRQTYRALTDRQTDGCCQKYYLPCFTIDNSSKAAWILEQIGQPNQATCFFPNDFQIALLKSYMRW